MSGGVRTGGAAVVGALERAGAGLLREMKDSHAHLDSLLEVSLRAAPSWPTRPGRSWCSPATAGLMFSVAELATAAELGLTLPVIVASNGGVGEIRGEMRRRGITPLGVDQAAPDSPPWPGRCTATASG